MFSSQNHALLQRDFILAKIDTDRYSGGQGILDQFCPVKGGIPWFVFLEPDAQAPSDLNMLGATALGDANLMDGKNVGSPYTAKEIAAFEGLLRKVARNLDDEAFAQLHTSLLAQGEKKEPASGTH